MSEKKFIEKELTRTKGRWNMHLKLHITVLAVVIICELIGVHKFSVGPGFIVLLPLLYAVILTIIITPDVLGKVFKGLKRVVSMQECELAVPLVMICLVPLGVKYGTLVGPAVPIIIKAGPAFVLQEFGNLGTIFLALPIALLLGLKRECIGATVSICREPTLAVIGESYGLDSAEGRGFFGTYITGTVLGAIFFGLLGGFGIAFGLHPLALAMACGVGSASMMTASSASLATVVPAMSDKILAFAATSNLITGVTGMYMVIFIGLPLVNKLYSVLQPKIQKGGRAK